MREIEEKKSIARKLGGIIIVGWILFFFLQLNIETIELIEELKENKELIGYLLLALLLLSFFFILWWAKDFQVSKNSGPLFLFSFFIFIVSCFLIIKIFINIVSFASSEISVKAYKDVECCYQNYTTKDISADGKITGLEYWQMKIEEEEERTQHNKEVERKSHLEKELEKKELQKKDLKEIEEIKNKILEGTEEN